MGRTAWILGFLASACGGSAPPAPPSSPRVDAPRPRTETVQTVVEVVRLGPARGPAEPRRVDLGSSPDECLSVDGTGISYLPRRHDLPVETLGVAWRIPIRSADPAPAVPPPDGALAVRADGPRELALGADGTVTASDRESGRVLWSRVQTRFTLLDANFGRVVLAGAPDAPLLVLAGCTGERLFENRLRARALALRGDVLYVAGFEPTAQEDHVVAIEADSGRELWRTRVGEGETVWLELDDDAVYACGGRTLAALDRSTGVERWRHEVAAGACARISTERTRGAPAVIVIQTARERIGFARGAAEPRPVVSSRAGGGSQSGDRAGRGRGHVRGGSERRDRRPLP